MAKYRFEQIAINCKEKVKADDIDTSTYFVALNRNCTTPARNV